MNFIPHPSFPERAKFFYEKYDVLEIIETGEPKFSTRSLQKKTERICRFCGKNNSETSFENDSHLVSKLMGNTDLFSDFECDKCNSRFSQFETDLTYFIGISRSITGLSAISKAPGFVTGRLSIKSRSFAGENILILSKKDLNEENNLEDRKAGKTTITYNKPPYTPVNVYKALLKSAISLLPEIEVKSNYANVIEYLKGGYVFKGAHVYGYTLPFQVNMPLYIQIYKKRFISDKIHTHVFGFHFQNYIIYIPLPLHKNDMINYSSEGEVFYAPPYFLQGSPLANFIPTPFEKDLTSTVKKGDDQETMTMIIDPEILKDTHKYDPQKNHFSDEEYNPINTKYIVITKGDTTFTKEQMQELTDFLKREEARLSSK